MSNKTAPTQARASSILGAYTLVVIVALGVGWLFAPLLYPPGGARAGAAAPPPQVETFAAFLVMTLSLVGIASLIRPAQWPRTGATVAYALVFAIGAAALWRLPQWSGIIAVDAFAVLVVAPFCFVVLSRRRAHAGDRRAAAVYWRLASCLHPSRAMRFYGALLRARALGSTDAEIASYASLRPGASPAMIALLDGLSAFARDDWAGVLDHSRGVPTLKGYEVRALGELGRVEEMIAAFVAWRPKRRGRELELARVIVLAFAGRLDGLRTLLRKQARFLRPDRAAYWSFVAATAAGVTDDSRPALAQFASTSTDAAFRRSAERHLAVALPAAPPALSAVAAAMIAEIETAVGRRPP